MDDSPVKHFLLKFDVTGVGSQTITNAKIRLYNTNAASEAGDFYHVTDDSWQEEIITWNNAPAAETTLLASLGSVNANTWYEVDVTAQITGDGTYSFRISDSVGGADYSSKEGANDPELVLTLGGTPVATNTPTLTPTTGPSPTPTNTSIATATFTPTPTQILPLFSNADFTYDGDGKRVKSVITTNVGTTTKYIVGTHYEVADGVVTKYYYAGKQRIAVRTNGTLNYLLGDHLASTSLITDANGQVIDQLLGNGLLQQSCYDANTLRLTKLRMYSGTLQTCGANPSSPRLNLSYTYQDNGNISQMVDSTRNETLNYTYDELNRLKTVNGPYSQNYNYNAIGNITDTGFQMAEISADRSHTCAETNTGGAKCWGNNTSGRLGDGTSIDRTAPVSVSGLATGVSAISSGGAHTCALMIGGGAKCWGKNANGQLGDGTTTQRTTPVDVSGLTSGVSTVSAGADHTCARTTSGGAKCWGDNIDGQLGDGTNTDRLTPTNVSGLTSGVGAVSSGGDHSCALTTTGGVKCWGGNPFGQLGDGTLVNTNAPVNTLFTPLTTYTYGNTAHKHAVTSLATGESYNYDANGNMITRVEGGLTYTQTFDAENRLISVTVSGQTTQFVYDGDGNLVKKVKPDGSKTLYVGGIYEVDKNSGGTVTGTKTYYPAAGAMRIGSTLYYVLKDHLGSASIVTNSTGTIIGEDRFYPFGETRFTTGAMYTDKLFTGQREMAGLGIYHYGARFYSPKLGRFLSPDTIVPGYTNPQNLNRFSYVTNNPLRYTDPTGHMMVDGPGDKIGCSNSRYCQNGQPRPPIVNAPSLNRPNRPNNSTVTTSTPSVTNVPPPALPPVPSVTPPPLPTISSLGTPSNTPSPFVSSPQIVTTQTPTPPLGWSPSGDPEWFQYIDGQDMFLDGAGLVLDLVIPGVGGRPANAVQVIGTSLDLTDAAFGAIQTVQDTSTGSADWYTYASFATDIAGLGVPIVPDAVGIVFNVYHAHQLANQYP